MLNKPILKTIGFLILVSSLSGTFPAYAAFNQVGFQWVTPSEAPVVSPGMSPGMSGAPPVVNGYGSPVTVGGSNSPEIISPVIIQGQSNAGNVVAPVVAPPVAPVVNSIHGAPVMVQTGNAPQAALGGSEVISSAPRTTTSPVVPAVSSPSDVVQGFAKQVPLAVALRQLLPPGYGFSVDQNIDLGTLVSFQGGQPWRETMRAALDPVGLVVREQGQMVTIVRAGDQGSPIVSSHGKSEPGTRIVETPPVHALTMAGGSGDSVTMPASEISAGPIVQSWGAERGDTLHKILEDWSHRAKVEFNWLSEYDYPLQASVSFSGTFEDAVRNLLVGFEGAHPQPVAQLHANSNVGQMVLVVTTRGNNYSN